MGQQKIPRELQDYWDARLKEVDKNKDSREISFDPFVLTEIIIKQSTIKKATRNEKTQKLLDIFNSAFSKLSVRQKEVLSLYYGLDNNNPLREREIGKELGIAQPVVAIYLRRGKKRLKTEITKLL